MPDPKFYPKAKYHAVEKPRLVDSPEEEEGLGDEWFDHPNQIGAVKPKKAEPKQAEEKKPEKPSEPPKA